MFQENRWMLRPESARNHFWMLLAKANHQANPDSDTGEIYFTSKGEQLRSYITRDIDRKREIIVAIL